MPCWRIVTMCPPPPPPTHTHTHTHNHHHHAYMLACACRGATAPDAADVIGRMQTERASAFSWQFYCLVCPLKLFILIALQQEDYLQQASCAIPCFLCRLSGTLCTLTRTGMCFTLPQGCRSVYAHAGGPSGGAGGRRATAEGGADAARPAGPDGRQRPLAGAGRGGDAPQFERRPATALLYRRPMISAEWTFSGQVCIIGLRFSFRYAANRHKLVIRTQSGRNQRHTSMSINRSRFVRRVACRNMRVAPGAAGVQEGEGRSGRDHAQDRGGGPPVRRRRCREARRYAGLHRRIPRTAAATQVPSAAI